MTPNFLHRRRRLLSALVLVGMISPAQMTAAQSSIPECKSTRENMGKKKDVKVVSELRFADDNSRLITSSSVTLSLKKPKIKNYETKGAVTTLTLQRQDGQGRELWFNLPQYQTKKGNDGLLNVNVRFVVDGKADSDVFNRFGTASVSRSWRYDDPAMMALKKDITVKIYRDEDSSQAKPVGSVTFKAKAIKEALTLGDKQIAILEADKIEGKCVPVPSSSSGGSGGCFLTTAACETIGLADDCWELQTLRAFRDGYLADAAGGRDDIARYYDKAPAIADALRADPARLVRIYWTGIVPSAVAAKFGLNRLARAIYSRHMRALAA